VRLSNTGKWDNKKDIGWIDPYLTAKPMSEIFEDITVATLPSLQENHDNIGCEKCNQEGFIRDYDGTWLDDCECVNA